MAARTYRGVTDMAFNNLEDIFKHHIKDLYSAEQQLAKALPQMAKQASSDELKEAFDQHEKQTKEQLQRLEEIGEHMGFKVGGMTCKGMKGLIEEAQEVMKEAEGGTPEAMDAALIAAAQKAEHYEITSYGTAATFAEELGNDEVLKLLKKTLDEEEKTDERLSKLAKGGINKAALQA